MFKIGQSAAKINYFFKVNILVFKIKKIIYKVQRLSKTRYDEKLTY